MTDPALTIDGPIATLTLAGPLEAGLVERLDRCCEQAAGDSDIRVLVLQASTETWRGWARDAWERAEELGLVGDPFAALAALPQPTVAVVAGDVHDAGLELAFCTDIRIAATAATFAMPGVGGGTMPIAGGLQRISRAIGRAHALELVLGGSTIDAQTALQWGLVSAVVEDPQADAQALAQRIAQRGPIATRFAKEAVRRGLEMPLDQALRYETDLTVLLQTTADRAEGVEAFREKRTPRFEGR